MITLAWRNTVRHRARTILALSVIAIGVCGVVLSGAFIEDVFIQLRESTIHSELGHIQVSSRGYQEHGAANPLKFVMSDTTPVLRELDRLPAVELNTARLSFTGVINNGHSDVAIVGQGVEPGKDARLGSMLAVIDGRRLEDADRFGAVLGEGIARATRLKPGDRATLVVNTAEGALNTLDIDVIGVFRSFSKDYDAHAVRIPLAAAQELLASSSVNVIVVGLKQTDDTEATAASLRKVLNSRDYEVKTWLELADFYEKAVALYRREFGLLQAVILIAVLLSVANTVNMALFERTGEFGTMLAIGNRSRDIFRLILVESAILGALGALAGMVLAIIGAAVINRIGITMPPPPNSSIGYVLQLRVNPVDVAIGALIAIAATFLATLLPARRMARIPIVDALRAN